MNESKRAITRTTGRFILLIFLWSGAWEASAQTKSNVPAEQWRQDIDTLQQRLPALHPNFFARYPRPDFVRDMDNLKASLAGKSDFQIALELQGIVAKAGDAQTRLDLTDLMLREKIIPFALSAWSDGLYISATVKQFEAGGGAKILKVNGLDAQEALTKMGRFAAQENEYTHRRDALSWFRFPVALRMAGLTSTDTLALLVEKKNGQTAVIRLYPLDPANPANRAAMQPIVVQPPQPDLRWRPVAGFFTQTWLTADSVLYVRYDRCVSRETLLAMGDTASAGQLPAFQVFADSIFTFLAKTPQAKVLVDLRFNPGGKPSDGIALARRFAALPQAQRPAQLFVATNIFTQGAATEVAACFSSVAGATLIGEASGTRPNHYDGVRQFLLSRSRITVQFSTQYRPVQPEDTPVLLPRVVIPVTFEQYRLGQDPVLDFVRNK